MSLFDHAGLTENLKQEIFYSMIFFSSGIFVYFLAGVAFHDENKFRRYSALVSAIFYQFNSFVMINMWHRFSTTIFVLPFLPLLLGLYIYGLKKKNIRIAVLIGCVSIIFSFVFSNPPLGASLLFPPFLYLIFYLSINFSKKSNVSFALFYSFCIFVLFIAVNLWWILPYSESAQTLYQVAGSEEDKLETLRNLSAHNGMVYILRLLRDISIHTWGNTFPSFFNAITTLIPLIVFFPLLTKRTKHTVFFILMTVFGILLMAGTSGIFGNVFEFLFLHLPFFGIFRNSYEKLGLITVLGYSLLFGIGLMAIYEKLGQYKIGSFKAKLITLTLFLLVCVVPVFPMWTGKIIKLELWGKSSLVKIPDEYKEADQWLLNQKENFRVISYPITNYDGVVYSWQHGYCGDNMEFLLLGNKPFIGRTLWTNENFETITRMLQDLIYREDALHKFAPILNVKYLLLHNDLDKQYIDALGLDAPEAIRQGIDYYQKGLTLEKKFGDLEFYKFDEKYFLPHIWAINAN